MIIQTIAAGPAEWMESNGWQRLYRAHCQHADEGAASLTPPPQAFVAAAAVSGRPLTQPQPPERSTASGEGEQAQPAPRQTFARFLDQLKAQARLQTINEQAPAKLLDHTPPAQVLRMLLRITAFVKE